LSVEEYEDYKNYMQLKERDSKKAEVDKLEKKVIRLKDKIKEINEQKQIIKKKYRL
jgi:phage shock protein A